MDTIELLVMGFQVLFSHPESLVYCFIGVFIGTLTGVLPGIGPPSALALLLPITFHVPSSSAIIMLAGIAYGAMYGGSITSILVNIPGEAASVVTCLDGYQMALKGRAGSALGISAIGSFIAGTLTIFGLVLVAPALAELALGFGPPEYFALVILGLSLVVYLAKGSAIRAVLMGALGIFLGSIGQDPMIGTNRFTFGNVGLMSGVGLIPMIVGLFGVSEVMLNLQLSINRNVYEQKLTGLYPTLHDIKVSILPILRGSVIGFFMGIIPGMSVMIPTFVSYIVEKRVSKRPQEFGSGAIEGVAGPEAANNAASVGILIPTLSLGIPTGASTALILSGLIMHGLQPGPLFITKSPDIFWCLVASLYIGNVMLLILNLPLVGIWVKLLKIPYSWLFIIILLFCLIGSYTVNNNMTDVFVMLGFSVLGYLMIKFDYERVPLILGLILGPIMETAFRRSLVMSDGSISVFVVRPVSLILLCISGLMVLAPMILQKGLAKATE